MSKYSLKDIKRAIEYIEKAKTNENIEVSITHSGTLLLSFFDDLSGDKIDINIYDADSNIFPRLTKTERL